MNIFISNLRIYINLYTKYHQDYIMCINASYMDIMYMQAYKFHPHPKKAMGIDIMRPHIKLNIINSLYMHEHNYAFYLINIFKGI